MKKYIGLTLFLLANILLVYFLFWNKINSSEKKQQVEQTGNVSLNINHQQEKTNDTVISEEKANDFNNDFEIEENKTWDNFLEGDLALEKNSIEENDNKIPDTLVIWNITLKLAKNDKTYDDIFDILGFLDIPKYKVEGKKIYIKKIDSIDYEGEKINIEQLIQKIWGNIAEVNWFWDKQMFVNLDPYYKKESISFVEYRGNLYLMVLPYDKYYEYEKVIKEFLFDK